MPLLSNNIKSFSYAVIFYLALNATAQAAQCGNSAGGFESWKQDFLSEAARNGLSANALEALKSTHYSTATIGADRGQKSFRLTLEQFLVKRGGSAIVARGRVLKRSNAALLTQSNKDMASQQVRSSRSGVWKRGLELFMVIRMLYLLSPHWLMIVVGQLILPNNFMRL